MNILKAFPTLTIGLTKKVPKSPDFVLEFVYHQKKPHKSWLMNRIGFFIKQPDGTFSFEYKDETAKKMFADILNSEDAIEAFFKYREEV